PSGNGPWSMIVESVGSPREGQQVATLRTVDGGSAGFRLAATLPRYPPIEPGDRVAVEGRTGARPDSAYGRYLERLGAWGTLDARSMEVLPRPVDPGTTLEGWRRDAGELLTRVLPEPEAGLAAGILIGLRDRVDRQVAANFTTAGVSHVVAISGWNIAIVAAAVGAFAGRLGRRRRTIVTAVAIVSYIVFAGASPSVLRAGAMAGVVLLARESGRSGRAAAALGWAAFLLLLVEPSLVSDAGFQLSTLATAGLVAWATPLTERLDRLTRGRLPRWLTENLGVSLAAQAATLPVILASFGRLSLVSPVVNLLVVPLVAPAMAAGLVALLGGALVSLGAPSVVGAIVAAPGWVALRLIIAIVEVAASVPLASVAFEPAVGGALGVATALVGLAVIVLRRRSRSRRAGTPIRPTATAGVASRPRPNRERPSAASRMATMALVVAVAVAGGVIVSRPSGVARITILDIGQGDAILVEGSHGGRLLIDGGPDPDRLLVELDRRVPPWDRRLDAVILSHPHEDHVAGLALLLDRYRVGRVLEPGMRGPGPGYAAWIDRLARPGAPPRLSIGAGDRLTVDEIAMRVLWPIRGKVPAEPPDTGSGINNVSVVLLGVVGQRRFLLAGDVEQDIDPSLLAEGLPTVDLLKVAHHGSKTATTDAFLAAVRPKIAVASAGTGNPYGHPARRTLERLAATGARVYRTDVDGSVTVAFEPTGLAVRTQPRRGTTTTTRAVAAALTPADGPIRSFLCGIPTNRDTATPSNDGPPLASDDPPPGRHRGPSISVAEDTSGSPEYATPVGYDRFDDPPSARGSVGPAIRPRSAFRACRARPSRRRRRGRARDAEHRSWCRTRLACGDVRGDGLRAPDLDGDGKRHDRGIRRFSWHGSWTRARDRAAGPGNGTVSRQAMVARRAARGARLHHADRRPGTLWLGVGDLPDDRVAVGGRTPGFDTGAPVRPGSRWPVRRPDPGALQRVDAPAGQCGRHRLSVRDRPALDGRGVCRWPRLPGPWRRRRTMAPRAGRYRMRLAVP
ncbi:MAG: competence protein ComEC, partial [Chloroflexota bacterium]|nr:competence protein ComEC [Chloroflexota bacterium]